MLHYLDCMEHRAGNDYYLGSSFYFATHVIFTAMPRNLVAKARIKPNAILHSGVAAATTSEKWLGLFEQFSRTISGALGVHNGAELSTAGVGACDVPADAVDNSGRTSECHSMQPLPVLAGWHSRPRLAFGPADWNVVVRRCTSQCGLRSVFSHQPRWHRRACTHART